VTGSTIDPSVKGSIFVLAVSGVQALIDARMVSTDELEAGLEALDLRYIEEKLLPGGWYSIDSFDRIARFALDRIKIDETGHLFPERGEYA
jgi:hypothetical protein